MRAQLRCATRCDLNRSRMRPTTTPYESEQVTIELDVACEQCIGCMTAPFFLEPNNLRRCRESPKAHCSDGAHGPESLLTTGLKVESARNHTLRTRGYLSGALVHVLHMVRKGCRLLF